MEWELIMFSRASFCALHQAERDSGRVPTTLGSALGTGTNFEVLWCPGSTAFRVPTCQCANHRAGSMMSMD